MNYMPKRKKKKKSPNDLRKHTEKRLTQRFGINDEQESQKIRATLKDIIQNKKSEFMYDKGRISFHYIKEMGIEYVVAYDRNKKEIATVLDTNCGQYKRWKKSKDTNINRKISTTDYQNV
ncbi:hypothetical protein M0R19_08035 [Candidatus Pacearchaeota archaeon]|nr:hypothetical protein [Candidatus Pacearchaeota archaeon]